MRPFDVAALHAHVEADYFVGAVHQDVVLLFGEVFYRRKYAEIVVFCHGCEILDAVAVEEVAVCGDGVLGEGEGFVGDDEVGVEIHLESETVAFGAGAERAVEREHSRLKFLVGEAADRAGKLR